MELIAIFSPLAGFLIAGLFGRLTGEKAAMFVSCASVIIAAIASCALFGRVVFSGDINTVMLGDWIVSGDFSADWALRMDQLSVLMMCVVNLISSCVHLYSIGYMKDDPCKARFFAYLNLFTFAMLMLVSADNLLQLFFGWEGVGLTSYLLIGFWNRKQSANSAAIKAFVVNRIGDFAFLLGILTIFVVFESVRFDEIFELAPTISTPVLNFIGILLFIGAMGKSAQLGLHTWLPDAMEGPTPVSALIHAATMVTAGVFLVARFSPLYEYAPLALSVICVTGALTAFVAATIAVTQNDIKRVIAYSTMSQLGYMFFALGVSAYGAAMFHLTTHAFFKALLFLGAGSVIHAMSGEQDMRKMGGIWKKIPATYVFMWVGSLALAGMPFFAGFYSKDIILEAVWADKSWFGTMAFWLGIAAAFMTAFYSWRLIIMTFHGKPRADEQVSAHLHESPNSMLMPLTFLAMGAIFAGSYFYGGFVGDPDLHVIIRDGEKYTSIWNRAHFWGDSLKVLEDNDTVGAAHHVPLWVKIIPVAAGIAGIFFAYLIYMWRSGVAAFMSGSVILRPFYVLSNRKWFFDEVYNFLIVSPVRYLGRVFSIADRKIIDRAGPDGLAGLSNKMAMLLSRMQSGYLYHYAFVMIGTLAVMAAWFILKMQAG